MTVNKKLKEQDINFDKNSLCFGYKTRISILIVLFAVLAILLIILASRLINHNDIDSIKYLETGNITYDNIVNDNVTKEIDKIKLNYNYKINYDKKITGKYNIKIKEKASFYDSSYNELYVEEHELYNKKIEEHEVNSLSLNKEAYISYKYFNDIAKEYISKYNKDIITKLDVYLVIESNISPVGYKEKESLDSYLMTTVSLGKNDVDYVITPIDKGGVIEFKQNNLKYHRIILEVLIIIFILITIIVFIKLNKLLSKLEFNDSVYDKETQRLLKRYDRIIVNVKVMPDKDKYPRVPIEEFDELLDLKDNVHEPIRFYEEESHKKCYFFIKHNEEVFIYTINNKK